MVKIIWTELAIDDLKNIFQYIALDSKVYAKTQVNKLIDRVQILEKTT